MLRWTEPIVGPPQGSQWLHSVLDAYTVDGRSTRTHQLQPIGVTTSSSQYEPFGVQSEERQIFTPDYPTLNEEFLQISHASSNFPPIVSIDHQIASLKEYFKTMASKIETRACASCNSAGHWKHKIAKTDYRLQQFWEVHCDNGHRGQFFDWLDQSYSQSEDIIFCSACYKSVLKKQFPSSLLWTVWMSLEGNLIRRNSSDSQDQKNCW